MYFHKISTKSRSSHPDVFYRKGVLKTCSKFTGEHPCWSVVSIMLLCNYIKIAPWHGCSRVNLLNIFRSPTPLGGNFWKRNCLKLRHLIQWYNPSFWTSRYRNVSNAFGFTRSIPLQMTYWRHWYGTYWHWTQPRSAYVIFLVWCNIYITAISHLTTYLRFWPSPKTHHVNWAYIRLSGDVVDVFWTSYVRSIYFFIYLFFSPLMYNHTTSSKLYYKYLQNLQRLHAKYAQSAKTTELNLRNTARKTLDKNAMLALSPKPNAFVCWLGNDNNKESIRR